MAVSQQQDFAPKPGVAANGTQLPAQRIGVSGVVTSFAAFSSTTNLVIVEVQGNNVYATVDGTAPSATNYHLMYPQNVYHWNVGTAQNAKFITASAGTSSTIQASQFAATSSSVYLSNTSVFLPPPITSISSSGGSTSVFATITVNGLATVSSFIDTGTAAITGAVTMYSTLAVTGIVSTTTGLTVGSSLSVASSCTVCGVLSASSLTLTTPLTIANGGTNAATVSAANQSLTTPTQALTESAGAVAVNWGLSNNFRWTLNSACTVSFSNAVDGQTVLIKILQASSTSYTVTWPTIKWANGSAPVQSSSTSVTDTYTINYDGIVSSYFGAYVQNMK